MHTSYIGTTTKILLQLFSHLSFIFLCKSLSAQFHNYYDAVFIDQFEKL